MLAIAGPQARGLAGVELRRVYVAGLQRPRSSPLGAGLHVKCLRADAVAQQASHFLSRGLNPI